MYEVGTPLRFMSPYTNNIIVSEVMLWAGFKVVTEFIPAQTKVTNTGLQWVVPEQTRHIRLTQLISAEVLSSNEYFLHKLKNG